MLQPGMTFSSVQKVSGSEPNYRLEEVSYNNFAMKAVVQLDYLFSEYFGIFIAETYIQPIGHQLLRGQDSGILCTSIGVTSFF